MFHTVTSIFFIDSPGCCSCFTRLFRGRNRNRGIDCSTRALCPSLCFYVHVDGTTSTLEEEPGSTSGQSNHSSQQTLPGSSQQDEEQTATNGKNKQPQFELQAVKERKSLHKIFLQSDFNVGAEWMAYQHYKPHLGCIEYLGVRFEPHSCNTILILMLIVKLLVLIILGVHERHSRCSVLVCCQFCAGVSVSWFRKDRKKKLFCHGYLIWLYRVFIDFGQTLC